MKVMYRGETSFLELTHGKVYDVIAVEGDWYRIIDESGEDYLYPPEDFSIEEPNDGDTLAYSLEEAAKLYKEADWRGVRQVAERPR